MKDKDNLGNPMAVMAAADMLKQNPQIMRGVGKGFAVLGIVGGGYFGVKWIKKRRQIALLNSAGTNPDIKAVVDIYDAIPDGLKKTQGGIFNPIGLVKDLGNQIARIWTSTDTENLLKVAKNIYAQKLNIRNIYSKFNMIYGEPLYPLLHSAMSKEDFNKFNNLSNSGSVSDTAKLKKSKYAIVKITSGVTVREKPDVPNKVSKIFGTNKIGVVPFGKVAGIATGEEVYNKDDNTVFVELLVYDKSFKIHKAYAWKGAFNFVDNTRGKQLYHFDNSEFNGLQGNNQYREDLIS